MPEHELVVFFSTLPRMWQVVLIAQQSVSAVQAVAHVLLCYVLYCLQVPASGTANNIEEALQIAGEIGRYPLIIRPAFTCGGTGGGIAYNVDEFKQIVQEGLDASMTNQVLVEISLIGWKEFELEVMRDLNDNCVIICSIENVDPMGVHTGARAAGRR